MTKYYISLTVEAENIASALYRVLPLLDKYAEGSPEGVSEIAVSETK